MTREEKVAWMALWAANNNLQLVLEGECGFGRPCVGVTSDGSYPDYEWHDEKTYDRIDGNGDVWTPPHAYHKHPCVAVLGHGEESEAELYEWLKWFDANGFKLETGNVPLKNEGVAMALISVMVGKHRYARMVRKS